MILVDNMKSYREKNYIHFLFLASSITYEKLESRVYLFHGRSAHWKTLHSVPHDLGDPGMFIFFNFF
jgi:hypothetical protein